MSLAENLLLVINDILYAIGSFQLVAILLGHQDKERLKQYFFHLRYIIDSDILKLNHAYKMSCECTEAHGDL